jgi:hypothetical protein
MKVVKGQMTDKFTPKARKIWNSIPSHIQEKLLSNVWCSHCTAITTITDFEGKIDETGDLVLTGRCATCGGQVARVIERG